MYQASPRGEGGAWDEASYLCTRPLLGGREGPGTRPVTCVPGLSSGGGRDLGRGQLPVYKASPRGEGGTWDEASYLCTRPLLGGREGPGTRPVTCVPLWDINLHSLQWPPSERRAVYCEINRYERADEDNSHVHVGIASYPDRVGTRLM